MWRLSKGFLLLAGTLLLSTSSKGQSDSVLVPFESIQRANLKFVELDECAELSDSLRSAVASAKNALHSKDLEIVVLSDQKQLLERGSRNKDAIIENLERGLRKEKRKKIGLFVAALGLLVYGVIK